MLVPQLLALAAVVAASTPRSKCSWLMSQATDLDVRRSMVS